MRIGALVGWSAVGTVVLYVAWIITAADDYDGGRKHFAATATGVLGLAFLATFVVSLALLLGRWLISKR